MSRDTFSAVFDNPPDADGVEWSRNMFNMLSEGGTWGVKRSGLLYRKTGDRLMLIARMPHDPRMPITAEQLNKQQQADIDIIKRYFAAADIVVEEDA